MGGKKTDNSGRTYIFDSKFCLSLPPDTTWQRRIDGIDNHLLAINRAVISLKYGLTRQVVLVITVKCKVCNAIVNA